MIVITVARKPLAAGTTSNVRDHGTGGLNLDATRIGTTTRVNPPARNRPGGSALDLSVRGMPQDAPARTAAGRWPTNLILSPTTAAELDAQSGVSRSSDRPRHNSGQHRGVAFGEESERVSGGYADSGGASRFFKVVGD